MAMSKLIRQVRILERSMATYDPEYDSVVNELAGIMIQGPMVGTYSMIQDNLGRMLLCTLMLCSRAGIDPEGALKCILDQEMNEWRKAISEPIKS